MDSLTLMRLDFNRKLLDAIGGQILDTSIFAWSGGFTSTLLAFCMAIAFFQSVLKSEKSMLVEWTKIIIASWFCLAILGGVQATKVPVFSQMNSSLPPEYKVKSKRAPTLERIVFNWMAWKFDELGKAIMESSSGKPENLNDEIIKLNTYQEKLLNAIAECDSSNAVCLRKYLTGDPESIKMEEQKTDPANKGDSDVSIMGVKVPGTGVMVAFMAKIAAFFAKIYNPAYWLFPILMWLLDIVRAFINFFVLLTFGIVAALSLFMTKILCVLMVIPSYRDRVIGMFKFTLSASMYGFAMNLMLWISIIITKALNEATGTIIIQRLTNAQSTDPNFALEMGSLMMSNFLTSFVIMLMQIVAMTKVPSFTEKLMNLSLQEIVNIGETLFKAGLGMAKVAAGMAAGVGGLALGAAGGALAGAASQSSALSGLGSSMSGKFRGMMGWNPSGPSDFGGAGGGGGATPAGGGGGGSMFTPNPAARGGGSDLANTALGEANLKATTSRKPDTLLKAEKSEDEMTPAEKLEAEKKKADAADKAEQDAAAGRVARLSGGSKGGGGADRALTVTEQRAKREADMKAGWNKLKTFGGVAGGALLGMAYDGAMGGVGSGDGLNTFKGTVRGLVGDAGEKAGDIAESAYAGGSKAGAWAGSAMKGTDLADRAENAESVYRSAVVGGKTDTTAADDKMLASNLAAINSGSASNEQMRQVLEAQNTKNLSKEQKDSIAKARSTSKNFGTMMADQEKANTDFLSKVAQEYGMGGGLSNETMRELSSRTSAGLMDYDQISKQTVGNDVETTTLGEALGKTTQNDIREALKPMTEKLAKGEALSIPEQQQARRMYDNNQDALVGQTDILDGFDKTLGGTVDTSGMRKSREQYTSEAEQLLQNLKASASKSSGSIDKGFDINYQTQTKHGITTKTGEVEGLYMAGHGFVGHGEYGNLSDYHKKQFDKKYNMLKQAVHEKETNNMVKERMADLRLNSDLLEKILAEMEKVKNGG